MIAKASWPEKPPLILGSHFCFDYTEWGQLPLKKTQLCKEQKSLCFAWETKAFLYLGDKNAKYSGNPGCRRGSDTKDLKKISCLKMA